MKNRQLAATLQSAGLGVASLKDLSNTNAINVVTVGQFTIPLMIRFGYRRAFAAGVEATASMGGQIMPPVMGAVAFIMAETLGVDYMVIVRAAVIPAFLCFAWREDWRVTPHGLELVEARVKGSGAGMEPPPQARLVDGWFVWRPRRAPMPEVVLGNSGLAGEWRLCVDGACRTLSEIFGHDVGPHPTTMRACE